MVVEENELACGLVPFGRVRSLAGAARLRKPPSRGLDVTPRPPRRAGGIGVLKTAVGTNGTCVQAFLPLALARSLSIEDSADFFFSSEAALRGVGQETESPGGGNDFPIISIICMENGTYRLASEALARPPTKAHAALDLAC